jgi:hypothetical protein
MNRLQLEHIIRAAGSIADDREIIVLGSASIVGQFPDFPEDLLLSVEADVFPKNKPHMSDVIDGSIGELSPFHQAFGYYAHGVGVETANNLPDGWDQRLVALSNPKTEGVTGWCVEIHDLVAGKYVSAREKDLQFIAAVLGKGLVAPEVLLARIDDLRVDEAIKRQIRERAVRDIESAAPA